MINIFKNKKVPKERGFYAFQTKAKAGEFLLFIEELPTYYKFMQLPDKYAINISKEAFEKSITHQVIEYIEQIPKDVFEVCKSNIEENG